MKIVLCKGQFLGPISGADETLVSYATQLKLAGHSVSVLLLYEHSPQDCYYIRLREAQVPVYSVASNSVRTSMAAGRKIARGLLRALPSSQFLVRRHAQRIATSMASRQYENCYEFLKQSGAKVAHVITPDPAAMVMISAAYAAGIPVLYQELGTPFHPPDYESYYEQFTTVLPLCTEIAALSPLLAAHCRAKLTHAKQLSVLPILSEGSRDGHGRVSDTATVTIGFAARVEHLKGPLILLESFATAIKKRPGLRLKIAGAGSLEQKFTVRARELGVLPQCDLVGVYRTTEERHAFMSSASTFCLAVADRRNAKQYRRSNVTRITGGLCGRWNSRHRFPGGRYLSATG
jgi:glycosyltransferase involved in cell wall biosynthesis